MVVSTMALSTMVAPSGVEIIGNGGVSMRKTVVMQEKDFWESQAVMASDFAKLNFIFLKGYCWYMDIGVTCE
ncbi:hypothetical protein L1987_83409 [Smallanthus sonchifolius]|uniref:Uncharacterized protein n=1 Tax=Smallanthus sonchifolius TaxID=185202 RepID=A0ACB8YC50_9ASTR|nr:hypothetical protein L1987_83409 [Smallanthus sonchifolius]